MIRISIVWNSILKYHNIFLIVELHQLFKNNTKCLPFGTRTTLKILKFRQYIYIYRLTQDTYFFFNFIKT